MKKQIMTYCLKCKVFKNFVLLPRTPKESNNITWRRKLCKIDKHLNFLVPLSLFHIGKSPLYFFRILQQANLLDVGYIENVAYKDENKPPEHP